MNFRICKKKCKMQCIRVVTYNEIGTTPFMVFHMIGHEKSCTFSVNGKEFTEKFSSQIEQLIRDGVVKYDDGHEGDPAFTSKRHIKLLDTVPFNSSVHCSFEDEKEYIPFYHCPYAGEHEADYMVCMMKE